MPGLPDIPNLDPNAPPSPAPAAEPATPAGPTPRSRTPTMPMDPSHRPEIAEAAAGPRAVPAPIKRPAPPAPPGDDVLPPSEVQGSVEEVLQQASEQTLKLSHLEDVLGALNQTLTDFGDEMHAGFAEVRAAVETSIANAIGKRGTEIKGGESTSAQHIESIEDQLVNAGKRQAILTVVALVQTLLLVGTLAAVIMLRPKPQQMIYEPLTPTPAPAVTAPPPPLPDDSASPPASDDAKGKDGKKKKGRRH
ncbi:MAG: hypothetical protein HY903_06020 [Deltaproteobacteria bacterium]|nr:hypothetical protein [Deltaproteobacteria bacterium]